MMARGDRALLATAGVLVVVALGAVEVRMDDEWGTGVFLALDLVAAVAVFGLGLVLADQRPADERPDGAATALLVAGLSLVLSSIINFADVLGAEGGPGSVTWVALLFAAIAAYPALRRNSPVSGLLSVIALGVAFVAAVDWIFDPDGIDTFRWLLLILAIAYGVAAAAGAGGRSHHVVQLVNAAGLAIILLTASLLTPLIEDFFGSIFGAGSEPDSFNGPFGWELVTMAGAAGVLAFAVSRRKAGPGYVGAIALTFAVTVASIADDEATLVGWPLVLVLLAAGAAAAAVTSSRSA